MMAISKAEQFSARLKAAMDKKGLNGADLVLEATKAAGTKIGRHRIQLFMHGEALPTAEEAAALATALGVDPDILVGANAALPAALRKRYTSTATGESREVVFSRNLNNAMNAKGWRQADLTEEAQKHMPRGQVLGRHVISNYCRGQNIPNSIRLSAIAKALGKTPEELLPSVKARFEGADMDQPLSLTISGDTARLRINMEVATDVAMQVMQLLRPLRPSSSN
jgi:transcriptional regulator with XRE-family HTH domain